MSNLPPVYFNSDEDSFAFTTARVRWFKIVQDAIDDIEIQIKSGSNAFKSQGSIIIEELKVLKEDLQNDGKITGFPEDTEVDAYKSYNLELKDKNYTWLTGPWLVLENYLYRLINYYFVSRSEWFNYDIFANLKSNSFKESVAGVTELAIHYYQLNEQLHSKVDDESLKVLFREFAEISLWGNATDLSLLATATLEDIKSVQGAKARKDSEDKILVNKIDEAWDALKSSSKPIKRVDFVLDNAGFELYTDLIYSLFLLDSKLADEIVLHTKDIPWMVSDVNIKDFYDLLRLLKDEATFKEHRKELNFLVNKLEYLNNAGKLNLRTSPFWTLDCDFHRISPSETKFFAADVYNDLINSSLVIFKGDMNYRKLTGDRRWPSTTPFVDSIGPLASENLKILSLRTIKADVLVDLQEGVYESITNEWAKSNENKLSWLYSGKYAVISFSNGSK